jgi:hypothetical protein
MRVLFYAEFDRMKTAVMAAPPAPGTDSTLIDCP